MRRVFRVDRGARGLERDVDAELAFHLEMRTRKLIANGLSPEAARAAALSQFGDYGGVRDECLIINRKRERRMQLTDLWANVRQDARYALRSLVEHRVFSLVVLLTLAIGIGANTAIFSVVDALLLRTLPVPHPEQLVTIGNPAATGTFAQGSESVDVFSNPIYADLRDRNEVFSGIYAIGQLGRADLLVQDGSSTDRVPEHPVGKFVTGNYFDVLQVRAHIGRTFTGAEDTAPNVDPFVVISDAYWQRRFAGDPAVVGRKVSINGATLTIVGVAPAAFTGDIVGGRADLWVPMMMLPALKGSAARLTDRSTSWLLFMGRLSPGKTLAEATQAVRGVIAQSLKANMTDSNWTRFERDLRKEPIKVGEGSHGFSSLRADFGPAILIMLGAVAIVLLVVCANVANLMLARAASRAREISVRLALGASRLRLVQQLLTESVLIAALAAVLGLAFAALGTRLILAVAAQGRDTPIPLDARLDARVLGFTSALTLVTVVLFGLLPALRATRVEVASALRTQGRGGSNALRGTSRVRLPLAKMLVVAQVGLSVLLLVGTGVLLRSMHRVARADLGLARDHLLIVGVDAQHRGYEGARLSALLSDLTARAMRVPGVAGVSYSTNGVFSGTESYSSIRVPGFEVRADSERYVAFDAVGPGYFRAVGTPLLRGRDIDARDDARAAKVAIVNETMAKYYFKNADVLGKTIVRKDSTYTIVGVVHDIEEQDVRAAPLRRMYLAIDQAGALPGFVNFTIRSGGDPAALVTPIRAAFTAADAALPVSATPVNTLVGNSVSHSILMTQVISFFGALTLLLAALGLYGVMAFTTARRTGEFGLRMALGARGSDVTRMVLREALALVAVGLVVGLPAGLGAVRLIRNELFQVGAFDPVTTIAAAVILALVAVVAAGLPAVRASRVAPVEALRAD